jgi:hypothetical protein
MYGSHMALNHLFGANLVNLIVLPELIDYPSGNTKFITDMIHIHVFHGNDLFSKFAFKMGQYNETHLNDSSIHLVKFYALKMALDSKKLSCLQLHELLVTESAKKK